MKIVRTLVVGAFMNDEELSIFLGFKSMTTVRTFKFNSFRYMFPRSEGDRTNFTFVLPIATIIVVNIMMRRTTLWARDIFSSGVAGSILYGSELFFIFPLVVFYKKLPVLFDESLNNRKFVGFKFLILWRVDHHVPTGQ